ncbi:MAG: hypothetical protein AB7I25_12130 [Vicinamibacterales bacterium]
MNTTVIRPLLALVLMVLLGTPAAAAGLDRYRDFALGASTADVLAATAALPRDLRTLHSRPSLLQELSWRPARGGPGDVHASISAILFSFLDDQLFRITVEYSRSGTEGLSHGDMTAALIAVYGPVSSLPAPSKQRASYDSVDTTRAIAAWREGDASVVLHTSEYSGTFGLVVTSEARESLARKAQAAAVVIDQREAPALESARLKAAAAAAKAADAATRTTNKATFQP